MELFLIHLKSKKRAIIKGILGGESMVVRLNGLGIRPGKKICKLSEHFWHGPVTILVDKSKIAIGYGIAKKILVEEYEE